MKTILILNHKVASSFNFSNNKPFLLTKHERDYRNFIEEADKKYRLKLFICHFNDFDKGLVTSAWTIDKGNWTKFKQIKYDVILDKCPLTNQRLSEIRNWLNENKYNVFNKVELTEYCNDKLNYSRIPLKYLIPTFSFRSKALELLDFANPKFEDFKKDLFVVKPRFGYGGDDVKFYDREAFLSLKTKQNPDTIIQPFLCTENGVPGTFIKSKHDLRLILLNGQIIQAYVRLPQTDSLASNSRYGSKLEYLDLVTIPKRIKSFAFEVDKYFHHYSPRLYSIDVGIGRSGKIWIFEFEAIPAIHSPFDDEKIIKKRKEYRDMILSAINNKLKN